MTDIVIQAENLGKKYTIGHQAENGRYVALRDVLVQNARGFWRTTQTCCAASRSSRVITWKKSGRSKT